MKNTKKAEFSESEEASLGIAQVADKFHAKREAIRKNNPNNEQRLFRAIQWAKHGLSVDHKVDRIILLWIAFNALYGREEHLLSPQGDRDSGAEPVSSSFSPFLQNIAAHDGGKSAAALRECRTDCEAILDCRYVYHKYWLSMDNSRKWRSAFNSENEQARKDLDAEHAGPALKVIFQRVRVLRNQLLHGAAAFFPDEAYVDRKAPAEAEPQREDEDHPFNGTQVRAGDGILRTMVPVFIDTVIDEHKQNCWGNLSYPPQELPDRDTRHPTRLQKAK